MRTKLLAAVASFAFVATGVAYAQDNPRRDQAAPGRAETHAPAAAQGAGQMERHEGMKNEGRAAADEQNKPAPKAAQEQRNEAPKAAQGEQRMNNEAPKAAQGQKGMETNHTPAAAQNDRKTPGEVQKRGAEAQPEGGMRRDNAQNNEMQPNRTAEPNTQRGQAERTGANDRNGASGPVRVRGNVRISSEHASRVSEVLRRGARPEHVDINIRVGEHIPQNVNVVPLPEDVIAIVPEYRGYDYFVDSDDEIVFVSPETHEIVGMIDYEGRAAATDATRVSAARPCPTEQ